MSTYVRLIAALLLLGLPACGPTEPAGEAEKVAPSGAGTVVKNDPALDAIVPADYEIEKLAGNLMFTERTPVG